MGWRILAFLVVTGAAVWFGLPPALSALGLHPHFEAPDQDLSGRRAVIITTSHDELGPGGAATGVFASEMTAPYYTFTAAGMAVDIASIKGGAIPIEPMSLRWPVRSAYDRRFLEDDVFQQKVANSIAVEDLDMASYDIAYLAGGWGAAYDLGTSEALGEKMTESYGRGSIVGGVCHGPLGLLNAKDENGAPLIAGRRLTAVTDKQVRELGITQTPQHPERELRAAGVAFEADHAWRDIFANHVVVDGRIVTGQNQNSGTETAVRMMEQLLAAE